MSNKLINTNELGLGYTHAVLTGFLTSTAFCEDETPMNETFVEQLRTLHEKHEKLCQENKFNWDNYFNELDKINKDEINQINKDTNHD